MDSWQVALHGPQKQHPAPPAPRSIPEVVLHNTACGGWRQSAPKTGLRASSHTVEAESHSQPHWRPALHISTSAEVPIWSHRELGWGPAASCAQPHRRAHTAHRGTPLEHLVTGVTALLSPTGHLVHKGTLSIAQDIEGLFSTEKWSLGQKWANGGIWSKEKNKAKPQKKE